MKKMRQNEDEKDNIIYKPYPAWQGLIDMLFLLGAVSAIIAIISIIINSVKSAN